MVLFRVLFWGLIALFLLLSCKAFNERVQKYENRRTIKINSWQKTAIVFKNDTLFTKKNKLILEIEHYKDTVELITLKSDTVADYIAVKSRLDKVNSILTIGTEKKYIFPKLYLNRNNEFISKKEYYFTKPRKGNIELIFSLPHINNIHANPYGKASDSKKRTGFNGYNVGVAYYHNNTQYVDLNVGALLTIPSILPIAVCQEGGIRTNLMTLNYVLSNNHRLGKFNFGYGISLAQHYWLWIDYGEEGGASWNDKYKERIFTNKFALGMNFPLKYELGKSAYFAFIYRPYFYQFSSFNKFVYQHTISLEIGWRIKLFNKHNNRSK